ncbi:MAG: bifunctional (p)ppGpp synthetase/guanosine-3',5'-bis(diphosphate) 3'-pyrophosphohydrolase [Candidatus Lokiarchaeota archaeon]|nr:bifunctional (p)ppGpp synthetase/guanosine-3',5'-bis(diphosphate) 3'-pyrophosphohydrolase [Candidatus Lokiarchaeota archaeon]
MREFENLWEGLSFAFLKYDSLKRKSKDLPYVIHPIRVTMILRAAGFSEFKDKNLFLAALFHDLLEDTDLTFEELRAKFGDNVALIVKELSKPDNMSKTDWLSSFITASKRAKIIKMADRIDNLMDMADTKWNNEKQKLYAEQGLIILDTCGGANSRLAHKLEEVIEQILNIK